MYLNVCQSFKMADTLGKKNLELLRTKFKYMYFDEERGTCDRFSYYSSAKQELDSYPELREISDKILKAVCYVYDKSKSDDFDVDTCKFLYFWLGNTLINKLNNTHFFAEAIIWLFRKLNENDNRKVCNVPYTDIDEGHFKKIKLIFEYFEDYEKYKLDFAIHNRSCNEDYYTYLKTYVDNYKQLHNECITERQRHMYCTEFVKYYDPQKHNDLLTWSCNLKETSPESNALPSNAEDLENQKKIDDRPRGVEQETKMKQRLVMAPQEHVRNPASLEPNLDSVTSETAITSNDSTRSITSKSITGAVSVAGFLVPSYLMYNYTPAGIWISKLLGRNKGPNLNSYANQELMANFSMPGDFYSERSRYNISYRPE